MQLQGLVDRYGSRSGQLAEYLLLLEEEIMRSNRTPAAFSVLLQRPSLTGCERFKLNELDEKPEQEEAIRKLIRLGGNPVFLFFCSSFHQ